MFSGKKEFTLMFSGLKEGGEKKAQTGFRQQQKKRQNKQKQTKDKKKLQKQ